MQVVIAFIPVILLNNETLKQTEPVEQGHAPHRPGGLQAGLGAEQA